jgi:heterotetrameric sarcosine oxidase delta subunit
VISLPCQYCGSRDAAEFAYIGERVMRPDPNSATPQEWRGYLYERRNPAGWTDELWFHRAGCGRYVAVSRNTVTGECRTTPGGGAAQSYVRRASERSDDDGRDGGGG